MDNANCRRKRRSRFRCHSRLIAARLSAKPSECSSTHVRPRVERAPVPALCFASRRAMSSVQPT